MRIKQPNWIPHGMEADLANRKLSGNGARLYAHLYLRANRQNGRLDLRYADVAEALERSKRAIVNDFAELREKGICKVDSAVNQHTLVRIEICDMFWPFEKANSEMTGIEVQYLSRIQALLGARACVKCDFGPSDQKFARSLLAGGIPIAQIEMAISLGCSRKYASLLNGTDSELILRFAYFRDLIEETREADPEFWENIGNPLLTKLEAKWAAIKKSALLNSAPARARVRKETR